MMTKAVRILLVKNIDDYAGDGVDDDDGDEVDDDDDDGDEVDHTDADLFSNGREGWTHGVSNLQPIYQVIMV